eukprot:403364638
MTVAEFKKVIAPIFENKPEYMRLICAGKGLYDPEYLSFYNIEDQSLIHAVFRCPAA